MFTTVVVFQLASLVCVFGLPAVVTLQNDEGLNSAAVLVRTKRDPSPSFTFSGFMPGRGMSAFSSAGDFAPYHPRRPSSQPAGWSPESEHVPEPATVENPPPQHPGEEKPWAQPGSKDEEAEEEEDPVTRPPKKNKKKYKPHQAEGDEEEYEKPSRGSGGNAAASFNAWFPIMLGMYPPSGYHGQGGEGFRGGYGARDPPARSTHTTVIANSRNYGQNGVASSHAVAYGGFGEGHGGGQSNSRGH